MKQMISDVAARLKALREASGLSLERAAVAAQLPLTTYRHYEERFKKPFLPMDLALKLADAFSAGGVDRQSVLALAAGDDLATVHPGAGFREPSDDNPLRRAVDSIDRPGTASSDLKIGTDGHLVQVIATVDRAGLDRLINRLEAMKAVID